MSSLNFKGWGHAAAGKNYELRFDNLQFKEGDSNISTVRQPHLTVA